MSKVVNIRKAKRAGARLVIGLAGVSGSGKTYTALQFAYGLANFDASKVGLLDAENQRGSLYADCLKNERGEVQQFLVGDLEPPFSPERYAAAIRQFQEAGVEVLVIDSASHEWEGTGGCEEIAESRMLGGMKDWGTAKREHKRFMNAMLQSNMHIIPCLRAREKVEIRKNGSKTEVVPLGIMPVCEKNFMFELTASLMMYAEGTHQDVAKCPAELKPFLARGKGYITAADGKAVRDWVDGAVPLDPAIEHARNTLRTTTEAGLDAYKAAWMKTPKAARDALTDDGTHATLKAAAEAFDKAAAERKAGGSAVAGLNDALDAAEREPAEAATE